MVILHPVNHLSTPCTTSMASLLLSFRSSQQCRDTLYIDVLLTDQHLVPEISAYQTTLRASEILLLIVVTLTTSPQGILCRVLRANFMQEATSSLPLMCSTRQPLRTNRQAFLLSYLISALLYSLHLTKRFMT